MRIGIWKHTEPNESAGRPHICRRGRIFLTTDPGSNQRVNGGGIPMQVIAQAVSRNAGEVLGPLE